MKLTATHIDPRAATVDLPYPEAEPARLRLELPMGKIDLEPGAGDSLISGKVTYNVAELKPRYSTKGRTVRIRQQYRALIPTGKVTNEWAFLLGTAAPYSLEVSAGESAASLDLGGLPLTNLTLESGAGDLNRAIEVDDMQVVHIPLRGAGLKCRVAVFHAAGSHFRIERIAEDPAFANQLAGVAEILPIRRQLDGK